MPMTAQPAPANPDTIVGLARTATCTAKAAHHRRAIDRMIGLATAAGMLGGQRVLAFALGIEPRSLRAKLSADRGVTAEELIAAANALDKRAARLIDHARKLRDVAAGEA